MSAVLPRLDHATLDDFQNVYEPSDDTFLLCDALLADEELIRSKKPRVVCEIGTGSGCVITYAFQLLEKSCSETVAHALYYATDINPDALVLAQATAKHNEASIEFIRTEFLNAMRMEGMVDVLIFNPPYVPTEDEEVDGSCGISAAWAGGSDGRIVIDRFLPMVKGLLRHGFGICYLLLVQENKPKQIARILTDDGLAVTTVISRWARNEQLSVLRITSI